MVPEPPASRWAIAGLLLTRPALLPPTRSRMLQGIAVGAIGLSLTTLLAAKFVSPRTPLLIPSLTYVVIIVAVAILARLVIAFSLAIVAFLLNVYFFAPPFHHLDLVNGTVLASLLAFVIVALIAAMLVTAESLARAQADAARRRLIVVERASGRLMRSLDYNETLRALADIAVESTADACIVDVLEDNAYRRVAVAVRDPADPRGIRRLAAFTPTQGNPIVAAVADGGAQYLPTARDITGVVGRMPEDHGSALADSGVHSGIVVPLTAPGATHGALTLLQATSPASFTRDDVQTAVELGRRAGLAVENARLYKAAETERERLAFLSEASNILSSSLAIDETLEHLTRLVVPRLADWCTIDIAADGTIRNLGVAHVDPQKVQYARELQRRYPRDPSAPQGAPNVIRTGISEYIPDLNEEALAEATDDQDIRRILRELKLRSAIIVPLKARGRTFGAITLISAESGRRYTREDVAFAEQLAERAGLGIDNARLHHEQSSIAQTLQRSLLPARLPEIPALRIATRYRAAGAANEVGGDFYDVWWISDDRFGFCIGDVCGKGAPAAAVTALTRHTIRTASIVSADPSPSTVLRAANDGILRRLEERRFCTVVYGYADVTVDGFEIVMASAGHPLPLIAHHGEVRQMDSSGTLLGVVPEITVREFRYRLTAGDMLVLWTDGVSERRHNGTLYGEERLVATTRVAIPNGVEAVAAAVEEDVLAFSPSSALSDDLALLIFEVYPAPSLPGGSAGQQAVTHGRPPSERERVRPDRSGRGAEIRSM